MKLCPNCEKPFEEKAAKLHCAEHGWHELNESGEIIPAAEPTQEEIAAFEAAQKQAAEPEKTAAPGEINPDPGAVILAGPKQPIIVNDKLIYWAAAAVGLIIIGISVYGLYKRKKGGNG